MRSISCAASVRVKRTLRLVAHSLNGPRSNARTKRRRSRPCSRHATSDRHRQAPILWQDRCRAMAKALASLPLWLLRSQIPHCGGGESQGQLCCLLWGLRCAKGCTRAFPWSSPIARRFPPAPFASKKLGVFCQEGSIPPSASAIPALKRSAARRKCRL